MFVPPPRGFAPLIVKVVPVGLLKLNAVVPVVAGIVRLDVRPVPPVVNPPPKPVEVPPRVNPVLPGDVKERDMEEVVDDGVAAELKRFPVVVEEGFVKRFPPPPKVVVPPKARPPTVDIPVFAPLLPLA